MHPKGTSTKVCRGNHEKTQSEVQVIGNSVENEKIRVPPVDRLPRPATQESRIANLLSWDVSDRNAANLRGNDVASRVPGCGSGALEESKDRKAEYQNRKIREPHINGSSPQRHWKQPISEFEDMSSAQPVVELVQSRTSEGTDVTTSRKNSFATYETRKRNEISKNRTRSTSNSTAVRNKSFSEICAKKKSRDCSKTGTEGGTSKLHRKSSNRCPPCNNMHGARHKLERGSNESLDLNGETITSKHCRAKPEVNASQKEPNGEVFEKDIGSTKRRYQWQNHGLPHRKKSYIRSDVHQKRSRTVPSSMQESQGEPSKLRSFSALRVGLLKLIPSAGERASGTLKGTIQDASRKTGFVSDKPTQILRHPDLTLAAGNGNAKTSKISFLDSAPSSSLNKVESSLPFRFNLRENGLSTQSGSRENLMGVHFASFPDNSEQQAVFNRNIFDLEIRDMMYAFGDTGRTTGDATGTMAEIVRKFLFQVVRDALENDPEGLTPNSVSPSLRYDPNVVRRFNHRFRHDIANRSGVCDALTPLHTTLGEILSISDLNSSSLGETPMVEPTTSNDRLWKLHDKIQKLSGSLFTSRLGTSRYKSLLLCRDATMTERKSRLLISGIWNRQRVLLFRKWLGFPSAHKASDLTISVLGFIAKEAIGTITQFALWIRYCRKYAVDETAFSLSRNRGSAGKHIFCALQHGISTAIAIPLSEGILENVMEELDALQQYTKAWPSSCGAGSVGGYSEFLETMHRHDVGILCRASPEYHEPLHSRDIRECVRVMCDHSTNNIPLGMQCWMSRFFDTQSSPIGHNLM